MENPEEIITIKTYYSGAEAGFAKNILESNGIKCILFEKTPLWLGGGESKLKVLRKDVEKSIKILEEAS
ncbi:MAG: hypothetical protein WCX77_03405 [Candidatus Paceibacterota bacterium]|jgi:hypothetical protein